MDPKTVRKLASVLPAEFGGRAGDGVGAVFARFADYSRLSVILPCRQA
jgi:hypothetical protein